MPIMPDAAPTAITPADRCLVDNCPLPPVIRIVDPSGASQICQLCAIAAVGRVTPGVRLVLFVEPVVPPVEMAG